MRPFAEQMESIEMKFQPSGLKKWEAFLKHPVLLFNSLTHVCQLKVYQLVVCCDYMGMCFHTAIKAL